LAVQLAESKSGSSGWRRKLYVLETLETSGQYIGNIISRPKRCVCTPRQTCVEWHDDSV